MKKKIQTILSKLDTFAFILEIFIGMFVIMIAMPFLIVYYWTMKLIDKVRK